MPTTTDYFWIDLSNVLWFHCSSSVDIRIASLDEMDTGTREQIKHHCIDGNLLNKQRRINSRNIRPMLNETKKHALAREFMNKFEGTDYKVPLSLDEFIDAHRGDMTEPELKVSQAILALFDDETRWDNESKLNCDICGKGIDERAGEWIVGHILCKTCYHNNSEDEIRTHFNIDIQEN